MQLVEDDIVWIVGVNWCDIYEDVIVWFVCYGDLYEIIIFDRESDFVIEIGVIGVFEIFILDCMGWICFKQVGLIMLDVWCGMIWLVFDVIVMEEVVLL